MADTRQKKIDDYKIKAGAFLQKARNLEDQLTEEIARPKLRKLIGKCFVYQNAGGGSTEGRWPLYLKIVSFNEKDMTFETVQFERWKTAYCDEVRIQVEFVYNFDGHSRYGVNSEWEQISEEGYIEARDEMFNFVHNSFSKT